MSQFPKYGCEGEWHGEAAADHLDHDHNTDPQIVMSGQFCALAMFIRWSLYHFRSQLPECGEGVCQGEGYGEAAEEEVADCQVDHKNISWRSHRLQVKV